MYHKENKFYVGHKRVHCCQTFLGGDDNNNNLPFIQKDILFQNVWSDHEKDGNVHFGHFNLDYNEYLLVDIQETRSL